MNKQELSVVVVLVVLLLGWFFFQSKFMAPTPSPAAVATNATARAAGGPAALAAAGTNAPAAQAPTPAPVQAEAAAPRPQPLLPEQRETLTNDQVAFTFSSWGAGVARATLKTYRAEKKADSGPVELDFSRRPALVLDGVPGLSGTDDFAITRSPDGRSLLFTRETPEKLRFERTVTLGTGYVVRVSDVFVNAGAAPASLPVHRIALGPVDESATGSNSGGYAYLGVDYLTVRGQRVMSWDSKIAGLFGAGGGLLGCLRQQPAMAPPPSVTQPLDQPVAWVAARNKYFTQIITPATPATNALLYAARNPAVSNAFALGSVSAELVLAGQTLQPGERTTRELTYYAGPKLFGELRQLGNRQDWVVLKAWRFWGWWRWCCLGLLWLLNGFYKLIPNYGVAIIALTVLVKAATWPLTKKSNDNMKKMQKIQPLLAQAREKYSKTPDKLQQATMQIYRAHGVNPMSGCLPMLLQMPIFIALFVVLRAAIELRFAPCLWIGDLSEPENLLAGLIPIAGSLNILPLLMTATMVWQQKLTPATGDPQQQKIMMFMPVFMLFLFYKMPSALVLYWTVSQVLSIAQLYWQLKVERQLKPA